MNPQELRRLLAENALLHEALHKLHGHPLVIANLGPYLRELAELRLLCLDVRTALLCAGWRDDEILRRLATAGNGHVGGKPLDDAAPQVLESAHEPQHH